MIKKIYLKHKNVYYDLQIKNVKNINLRIKADGTVCVSANRWVEQSFIDEFLTSKSDLILRALERYEKKTDNPLTQHFEEAEIKDVILGVCEKVYPYYAQLGIRYPKIKFRKMVSRWGSCHNGKGVLTFNTNLMYASYECIEYVVLHEFTHFLQPNHSQKFYSELEKVCPNWKIFRNKLKEINIR